MKLGDHVRALVGGEFRHGIACGDRTVLFLGRDASGRPEVRRALASEFASGAERVETVVHREPVHAPRAVVARAFSRVRDHAAAASFATSEAFAAWCFTGRPPEPGYGPAPAAARPARRAARKTAKPARRAPARKAAPKRKASKAAARASPSRRPRQKATARRSASRGKRRR
jgi:hypothetical protein